MSEQAKRRLVYVALAIPAAVAAVAGFLFAGSQEQTTEDRITHRAVEVAVGRVLSDPAIRQELQGERGRRGRRGARGRPGKRGPSGKRAAAKPPQINVTVEGDTLNITAEGGKGGKGGKGGGVGDTAVSLTLQDLIDLGLEVCVNPLQQQCRPAP